LRTGNGVMAELTAVNGVLSGEAKANELHEIVASSERRRPMSLRTGMHSASVHRIEALSATQG
jgi:hypothetical protein